MMTSLKYKMIKYLGLGATTQMCLAPFMCTTVTGECCDVFFEQGSIVCPISCNPDLNRQSEAQAPNGFTMSQIFGTTFVTTLMFNVLNSFGATTPVPSTTTTPPTTTTTTITTTTAPTITSCKD